MADKEKQSNNNIMTIFILSVVLWSCVFDIHHVFKKRVVKMLSMNSLMYSVVMLAVCIMLLLYINEYTLQNCGLI
jgi:hypothetical protein